MFILYIKAYSRLYDNDPCIMQDDITEIRC